MQLSLNKNKIYILTVLAMTVILFLVLKTAQANGQKTAQAKFIVETAESINQGLKNFYNDQNRFPTASEFEDPKVMGIYLSLVPVPQVISQSCSASFIYSRPKTTNFQLRFCLPKTYNSYKAGWNTISGG